MFDNGAPDFLDVYEFDAVNPDAPFGEERAFDSVDNALRFAAEHLGASEGLYVNQGVVQDEYKDRYTLSGETPHSSISTASAVGNG